MGTPARCSPFPLPYPIIFTVRLKFSTESSRFAKINFFTVFRWTPYSFAMRFTEIPCISIIVAPSSAPSSFEPLLTLPFGRPSFCPSAFFRSRASFVRWLIRFRSISAESPKAKASTFD